MIQKSKAPGNPVSGAGKPILSRSHPLIGGDELISSAETTRLLGRFVSYPPSLGKLIGIEETIFLLNLLFSTNVEGEWIIRDSSQLEEETGFSRKQQMRVRESLKAQGLLEENRGRNEVSFRIIESAYDSLILRLKRKPDFYKLPTVTSGSTRRELLQVIKQDFSGDVSINKEFKKEQREEEPPRSCPKPERGTAKREREERKGKVLAGSNVRREYQKKEPPRKPPEGWNGFAVEFQRLSGKAPISNPEMWDLWIEFDRQQDFVSRPLKQVLSDWAEIHEGRLSGWSAKDFLEGEWKMTEETEDDDYHLPIWKGWDKTK